MYHYGLWGDRGEEWIIDSFSTNAHITRPGTYRLIQQAFLRTLQHLRKTAPKPLVNALASLPLDAVGIRLRPSASTAERMLAFSKLVGQAYGFLQWFRHPDIEPMLAGWEQYPRSKELQATLLRILEENSRSIDPNAGSGSGRRVFRSDYVSSYEYARTYNDSIEGQTELQKRYTVERKNNELKNNCGPGSTNFRGRTRNQIIGLCAAMIVNLKHTVRKLVDPKPGFIRRPQMTD